MTHTYYETPGLWENPPEPYMIEVQKDLCNLLPHEVSSVLDVGCGNGFTLNALPPHLRVVGMDIAVEALHDVRGDVCCADALMMPFATDAFDLVMANDMIEHVAEADFPQIVAEIFRVARQSVIITVPFLENLAVGQVCCGACGHLYHCNHHQRSVDLDKIKRLAQDGWRLGPIVLSGAQWENEPAEVTWLRRNLGFFATAKYPYCPECGSLTQAASTFDNEDILRDISAHLSAEHILRRNYVPCRTESICCFYRDEAPARWMNLPAQAMRETATPELDQLVETNPMAVDFKHDIEFYRKPFLPTWGSQAYFYADEQVCTTPDGLVLENGEEVKIGFFPTIDAPVTLEGRTDSEATLEIRMYGMSGYQLVDVIQVQHSFKRQLDNVRTMFPLNPHGKLLAINCTEGRVTLSRCSYGAETPTQTWRRQASTPSNRYMALSLAETPVLLSMRYYQGLGPTAEAASTGVRSRLQTLQSLSAGPAPKIMSYLVQRHAAYQQAEVNLVKDLAPRVDHIIDAYHALQARCDALEAERVSLEATRNAVAEEQRAAVSRYDTLEAQFRAFQSEHVALVAEHATTLSQDATFQDDYDALEARHAMLESSHASLQRRMIAQASSLTHLEDMSRSLSSLVKLMGWLRQKTWPRFLWHATVGVRRKWKAGWWPLRVSTQAIDAPLASRLTGISEASIQAWETRTAVMLVPDNIIDRRVLLEARSLVRAGWRVTVVAAPPPTPDYRLDEELFPEVEIVRVDTSQAMEIPLEWRSPFVPPGEESWNDFYWLTNHYYMAAAQQPAQVIVAHDLPVLPAAVMVAARHQAFLVYDAHELYPEQHQLGPHLAARYRHAEAMLSHFPHRVVTVNASIAQEMSARYQIPEPQVILNCPDYDAGFPADNGVETLRAALCIPARQKILLFQGGLAPHRNLETLVEAMGLVQDQDVALVLMGPGEVMHNELEKIAENRGILGKRVFFHPPVPQNELVAYTQTADAGIIPYRNIDLNSYYCTPNKLFDFLVAGLPILANDSPELRKFVADLGVGMVHDMSDAQSLAKAIDTFFDVSHEAFQHTAQTIGKNYVWEPQGEKIVDMYEEMIQDESAPSWPII